MVYTLLRNYLSTAFHGFCAWIYTCISGMYIPQITTMYSRPIIWNLAEYKISCKPKFNISTILTFIAENERLLPKLPAWNRWLIFCLEYICTDTHTIEDRWEENRWEIYCTDVPLNGGGLRGLCLSARYGPRVKHNTGTCHASPCQPK